MCQISGYYSTNFHPISTKICPHTPLALLSNFAVHVRPAPGTSEKGSVKVEKDKSYATMDTSNAILVNIKYFNRKTPLGRSSYNLSRRLCAKFEPNRMASFRDCLRSGHILWEVAKIYAEKFPAT